MLSCLQPADEAQQSGTQYDEPGPCPAHVPSPAFGWKRRRHPTPPDEGL